MRLVTCDHLEFIFTKPKAGWGVVGGGGGYSLEGLIRGGAARKGYLFQTSGIRERVAILLVEVHERVGESVIFLSEKGPKGPNR